MGIEVGSSFTRKSGVPLDDSVIVANLTARDAIPSLTRYKGMFTYVESEGKTYQLVDGITNSDWKEFGSGGSVATVTEYFSGTGSQTDFVLTNDPGGIDNLFVFLFGVYQQKSTYNLSGTTLSFTTAPPAGNNNIEIKYGASLSGIVFPLSAPPSLIQYTSGSGNYTPSANTKFIFFRLWGPGGGGAGSARGTADDATSGSNGSAASTFGTTTANAGAGGAKGLSNGGAGGTATLGGNVVGGVAIQGNRGEGANQNFSGSGANGGASAYFAAFGAGGAGQANGLSPVVNTGAGGGSGGGTAESSGTYSGSGGGAGGYAEGYINNPGTISYSIGSGGAGGNGGTGPGYLGGNGAGGRLIIWEYK